MLHYSTQNILLIAFGMVLVLIIPYFLTQFRKKQLRKKRILKTLNDTKQFMDSYESRLQIVRSHAIDYLNTLGSDGARILSQIQEDISKINNLRNEAENQFEKGTTRGLRKAEKILGGKVAVLKSVNVNESIATSPEDSAEEFSLTRDWRANLEAKLQELGTVVATASSGAKSASVPSFGRQFKRETIHDLKEAGIDIKKILAMDSPTSS